MSYLHDEKDDDRLERHHEREVTLGAGTILGIFFGLALLCGAFFGLGFNMGSKARPAVPVAAAVTAAPGADFNHFKPSSGAPAMQTAAGPLAPVASDNHPAANNAYDTPLQSRSVIAVPLAAGTHSVSATPALPVHESEQNAAPVVRAPAHLAPLAAEPLAPGTFMVQVAAVSHAEDADLLISALKRKGYSVLSRTEPQDKLFHIQVGPFGNKKDAEAMRQRLLGDGYNAYLK